MSLALEKETHVGFKKHGCLLGHKLVPECLVLVWVSFLKSEHPIGRDKAI